MAGSNQITWCHDCRRCEGVCGAAKLLSVPPKENEEREVKEAKEAAHRRRIQELEEHKRHSWAGGEQVGGQQTERTET